MIGLARPLCVQPDAVHELLDGTRDSVGIQEDGLVIGRGRFGMHATNWLVKLINTICQIEYYGWQMTRMSRGLKPQSVARANAIGYFV